MPNGPLLIAGAGSYPAPYTVPLAADQQMTPTTINATWNGSGAATDFLPCVSYYSPEGVLLGRYGVDAGTITAGSSAEVSYYPFAEPPSAAAAGTQSYAWYKQTGSSGGASRWGSVTTNASGTFSIDGVDDTLAVVSVQGVYLLWAIPRLSIPSPPHTIAANQYIAVTNVDDGGTAMQQTLIVKGQTDVTLPNANAIVDTAPQLYGFSPAVAPYHLRASHSPVEAGLSVPVDMQILKIA